ncbi:MAG: hypothetical protein IKB58_04110 [Oscillospiraceae bacterium]|nr:hypothetical protein [Oscillospiraceae bacterium]
MKRGCFYEIPLTALPFRGLHAWAALSGKAAKCRRRGSGTIGGREAPGNRYAATVGNN